MCFGERGGELIHYWGKTNLKTKVIQSVLVSNITKYDTSLNVEIKGLMPLILEVQNVIFISLQL